MLLAAADRSGDRIRVTGQEIDDRLAKAAVAALVCEPPFDSPAWPQDELATDPRWEFGTPAPWDSELAWVQHCHAHLSRAVSRSSRSPAARASSRRGRRYEVRWGVRER